MSPAERVATALEQGARQRRVSSAVQPVALNQGQRKAGSIVHLKYMRYLGGVSTFQNVSMSPRVTMHVVRTVESHFWESNSHEIAVINPWPKGTCAITFGKTEQGATQIAIWLSGGQIARFAYEGKADLAQLKETFAPITDYLERAGPASQSVSGGLKASSIWIT